jgi:hypothetical protein
MNAGVNQTSTGDRPAPTGGEETLVPDRRAGLTPAQIVEQKLVALLKATPLPVSQMQSSLRRGPR